MKKSIFFSLFLGFFCTLAAAQSAEKVTAMIDAKEISFNQAAYFASSYLGLGKEDMNESEAAAALTDFISFKKLKDKNRPLTVENFAYMCVKVWRIPGGINYRIFKSPRYALREIKALGFIPGNADPDAYITGREALYIMSKCANYAESKTGKEAAK
ncbi:hypothetical protein H0R92_05315 [Treponema sp. OMZ 840]|uniref:hypothetical protein n=1 Tax=Treponema sp. OMZ 840 TaxID=244313 RepID=UPI003D948AF3